MRRWHRPFRPHGNCTQNLTALIDRSYDGHIRKSPYRPRPNTPMRILTWYRRITARRRAIVAVALASYLLVAIGIPLPRRLLKSRGLPFPCQDHACGCLTAEQCWEHCCCFSPLEKLAWCREHGVDPPAQLRAELASLKSSAPLADQARRPRSCCAKHEHEVAATHCASHDHGHRCTSPECATSHSAGEGIGGMVMVVGPLARQCRGMVDLWCLTGAVSPPPAAIHWQFEWITVGWLTPTDVPLTSEYLSPPVPPPRLAAV